MLRVLRTELGRSVSDGSLPDFNEARSPPEGSAVLAERPTEALDPVLVVVGRPRLAKDRSRPRQRMIAASLSKALIRKRRAVSS